MKRLQTTKFATAVVLALVDKLSKNWRNLHGYRDLYDVVSKSLARKSVA